MPINLTPWIILWAMATTGVLVLFVWRVMVAKDETPGIHVAVTDQQMPEVDKEVKLAHKLDVIDRWGKVLTVVSAVLVLVMGGAWFYNGLLGTSIR